MKRIYLLLLFCSVFVTVFAQNDIAIYPTHWWTGMKNQNLQLMIRHPQKNIAV
ncbi:MAG: cyclomaltodextrinase N-terminal domain-containing protein, partial [Bacteroidota bacterium]